MNRAKRERFAKPQNFREIWTEFFVQSVIEDFRNEVKSIEMRGSPMPERVTKPLGTVVIVMITRTAFAMLNSYKNDVGEPTIPTDEFFSWIQTRRDEWVALLPPVQDIRQGKKVAYIIHAVLERYMGQKEILKLEGAMMQQIEGFRNAIMREVMQELDTR